jgi:tetratricopeptide (TPR) repeat protein
VKRTTPSRERRLDPETGDGSGIYRTAPLALVVAAVAVLVRFPALSGKWVWDDILVVHTQLGAFRSLADVVFPPSGIPSFSSHYYRPLTIVSYLLDRALFGESPLGFHLSVLVAHAAAAVLVFLLARSLLAPGRDGALAALAGALIFATHPVLTESVCWIAGRADILAAVALLGALLALMRRPLGVGAAATGAVLFTAAALFKETAFGVLPLVPVLAAWTVPAPGDAKTRGSSPDGRVAADTRRRAIVAGAAFAAASLVVLVLRWAALRGLGADRPRGGGPAQILEGLGGALAFYLPRAIVPLAPAPYADTIPSGPAAIAGLAAGAALVVAAVACLRRPAARMVGLGLALFLALLAPSLGPALLQISRIPLAERYLYLPAAGLALACAGAISMVRPPRRRVSLAAAAGVVVVFAAVSFARTGVWRDEISLWSAAMQGAKSADPEIFLATALVDRGRTAEAETIYRRLLDDPSRLDTGRRALVTMNMSVVLSETNRKDQALAGFEEAVKLDPSAALGWYNLAKTLWETAIDPAKGTADRGRLERAREAAERAGGISPLDPRIQLLRGRIEGALGRTNEAMIALTRAAQLDPGGKLGDEARWILERMKERP